MFRTLFPRRPLTVDAAVAGLKKSLQHLVDVVKHHTEQHAESLRIAQQHAENAEASQREAARAQHVANKIGELIGIDAPAAD